MVGGAGTGVERVAGQPAGDSIVGYFRRLVPLGRFRFAQLSRGQDRPQAVLAAFLSHAKVVVAVACVLIAAEKEAAVGDICSIDHLHFRFNQKVGGRLLQAGQGR